MYTDLFSEYTLLLESAIERKVCVAIPGFSMAEFTRKLMGARKEELALDVFDLLTSLGDFATFKQLMLAYRKEAAQDAGARLTVECKKVQWCLVVYFQGASDPGVAQRRYSTGCRVCNADLKCGVCRPQCSPLT